MKPETQIKKLLQQATDLEVQARDKRIQAGKLLHQEGAPQRWGRPVLETYGLSSGSYGALLIEMYLAHQATGATPKIQKRKPVA